MTITLAANQIVSVSVGGTVTASASQAAAQAIGIDLNAPVITVQYALGTVSGNTLIPLPLSLNSLPNQRLSITFNLATGKWTSSSGLSGTIAPATVTSLNDMMLSWRNLAENFAVGNNVISGTYVAWASI